MQRGVRGQNFYWHRRLVFWNGRVCSLDSWALEAVGVIARRIVTQNGIFWVPILTILTLES